MKNLQNIPCTIDAYRLFSLQSKEIQHEPMYKIIAIMILIAATTGCFRTTKTAYNFPENIKPLAHGEFNSARECLATHGFEVEENKAKSVLVKVIPGQKQFNGVWGWQEPLVDNEWVLGLTTTYDYKRYTITVASHPRDSAAVHAPTIKHEAAHYWLLATDRVSGHPREYRNCFYNWFSVFSGETKVMALDDGGVVIVDYAPRWDE